MSMSMSIDMTLQKGAFFIMGVYAKTLCLLSDQAEMFKNVDTHHESFSSKKTSNKKVIAKKPLTNLHEMNSSLHQTPGH